MCEKVPCLRESLRRSALRGEKRGDRAGVRLLRRRRAKSFVVMKEVEGRCRKRCWGRRFGVRLHMQIAMHVGERGCGILLETLFDAGNVTSGSMQREYVDGALIDIRGPESLRDTLIRHQPIGLPEQHTFITSRTASAALPSLAVT